ncbi:hypothetical protein HanPI659440_Chr17g0693811 [Helianthus annuus]|nr:hypothetical protein HanPI659440_Chr17g0693811 [Helianthus annuus]
MEAGKKRVPVKPLQEQKIYNHAFVNQGGGRLFSDLFANNDSSKEAKSSMEQEGGKSMVISDDTSMFKEVMGRALVVRCKDLMILRKLNCILVENRITGASLSYLGGLSMLIKFDNEEMCTNFLLDHALWEAWFSNLDVWNGQSFPFERLAWVRVQGVPMHLADNEVFNRIAELFGKIVNGSQVEVEDGNLSVSWIGLLVGEGDRIHDHNTLRWKNKLYRVWIEEEFSEWVPDSIGKVIFPSEESSSPVNFRPENQPPTPVSHRLEDLETVVRNEEPGGNKEAAFFGNTNFITKENGDGYVSNNVGKMQSLVGGPKSQMLLVIPKGMICIFLIQLIKT